MLAFLKAVPLGTWLKIGAGLAIAIFIGLAFHWKHQAAERKDQLASICVATRLASNQPKLGCSEVPKQIAFMGEAIGTLTRAIDKQNAAVDAMGNETVRQQKLAAQASQEAAGRAKRAEDVAERLRASARAGGAPSAQCEPSKVLQEQWR